MSLEDRLKATAKNVEGKAQEILGVVTDNPDTKLEGQAKQVEAEAMHLVEEVKDKAKDVLNSVKKAID